MDHELALYGLGFAVRTAPAPSTPRPIVAVALADGRTDRVFTGAEAFLLARLDEFLAEQPAGILVTRDRPGLDLRYVVERAHRLRVPIGLRLTPDPSGVGGPSGHWYDHDHRDARLAPDPGGPLDDTDRAAHDARLAHRVVAARLASVGDRGPDRDGRTAPEVPVG